MAAPTVAAGGACESYLVLSNIGKKDNFKKLLALAVTYGLDHVLIVGQPHFDLATHAPPPSVVPCLEDRLSLTRFPDLAAAKAFLVARGVTLYGVEIVAGARLVEDVDFKGRSCAFMMGNEGAGMNKPQLEACDEFIVIPQYGKGTASLNVSNAAAIVLQYFALSRMASY